MTKRIVNETWWEGEIVNKNYIILIIIIIIRQSTKVEERGRRSKHTTPAIIFFSRISCHVRFADVARN